MGLAAPYRQRHPQRTAFYQCLEDYGPGRPVVEKTVQRFLKCGIFRQGFARVRCRGCDSEYLLAFSCKTRNFCPSCQAKRVAAFVEWVIEEVLEMLISRRRLRRDFADQLRSWHHSGFQV